MRIPRAGSSLARFISAKFSAVYRDKFNCSQPTLLLLLLLPPRLSLSLAKAGAEIIASFCPAAAAPRAGPASSHIFSRFAASAHACVCASMYVYTAERGLLPFLFCRRFYFICCLRARPGTFAGVSGGWRLKWAFSSGFFCRVRSDCARDECVVGGWGWVWSARVEGCLGGI